MKRIVTMVVLLAVVAAAGFAETEEPTPDEAMMMLLERMDVVIVLLEHIEEHLRPAEASSILPYMSWLDQYMKNIRGYYDGYGIRGWYIDPWTKCPRARGGRSPSPQNGSICNEFWGRAEVFR